MTRTRLGLMAVALTGAVAFALPAGAQTTGKFAYRVVTERADPGLAVTGPLSEMVATSRARVLIPDKWRRISGPAGTLRFRNTQNPSCRFVVTYRVASRLAPEQDPAEHVSATLPAQTPRHLLDSGVHGGRAWRVVRRQTTGRLRVDALWSAVLTRRTDIAPSGQVAWTDIRVTATSTAGSECHSGTYRQALGPTIGDSLAVARNSLRFTRK
jgi:hypothetical protein